MDAAFVPAVLPSSVDLTLIAGFRRQTVLIISFRKLSCEP